MRNFVFASVCASLLTSALVLSPSQSLADLNIWTGKVVHVSTTNMKVYNLEGKLTLGFLLVPKFKQIFSDDGKTTYQMAALKPGTWVTVYYDQDLLGARHADKIVILSTGKQMKS